MNNRDEDPGLQSANVWSDASPTMLYMRRRKRTGWKITGAPFIPTSLPKLRLLIFKRKLRLLNQEEFIEHDTEAMKSGFCLWFHPCACAAHNCKGTPWQKDKSRLTSSTVLVHGPMQRADRPARRACCTEQPTCLQFPVLLTVLTWGHL
jgi:hypothetical protein